MASSIESKNPPGGWEGAKKGRKMKKGLISFLAAVCLAVAMAPAAFATESSASATVTDLKGETVSGQTCAVGAKFSGLQGSSEYDDYSVCYEIMFDRVVYIPKDDTGKFGYVATVEGGLAVRSITGYEDKGHVKNGVTNYLSKDRNVLYNSDPVCVESGYTFADAKKVGSLTCAVFDESVRTEFSTDPDGIPEGTRAAIRLVLKKDGQPDVVVAHYTQMVGAAPGVVVTEEQIDGYAFAKTYALAPTAVYWQFLHDLGSKIELVGYLSSEGWDESGLYPSEEAYLGCQYMGDIEDPNSMAGTMGEDRVAELLGAVSELQAYKQSSYMMYWNVDFVLTVSGIDEAQEIELYAGVNGNVDSESARKLAVGPGESVHLLMPDELFDSGIQYGADNGTSLNAGYVSGAQNLSDFARANYGVTIAAADLPEGVTLDVQMVLRPTDPDRYGNWGAANARNGGLPEGGLGGTGVTWNCDLDYLARFGNVNYKKTIENNISKGFLQVSYEEIYPNGTGPYDYLALYSDASGRYLVRLEEGTGSDVGGSSGADGADDGLPTYNSHALTSEELSSFFGDINGEGAGYAAVYAAAGADGVFGMNFAATEDYETAETKSYADYNADFVLTSDKDVAVLLLGNYGEWGTVGFVAVLNAGMPFRVIADSEIGETYGKQPYQGVVRYVGDFDCVAVPLTDEVKAAYKAATGKNDLGKYASVESDVSLTLSLNLYKTTPSGTTTQETGESWLIGEEHTFKYEIEASGGSPVTPGPTLPSTGGSTTVTIPVSGEENTVHAEVTVTGTSVEVKPLDPAEIEQIVGDDVQTGVVEIDLSGLDSDVTQVTLPVETLEAITSAAEDAGNDTESILIVMPQGSVAIDDAAMRAVLDQAAGDSVILVLEDTGNAQLNEEQKAAIEGQEVHGGFEAYFECAATGERIGDFKGGTATLSVDFEVPEGKRGSGFSVWYVSDEGDVEKMKTFHVGGRLMWHVPHMSDYVVVYEDHPAYEDCGGGEGCPLAQFPDVKAGAWYHDGLHWAVESGVLKGGDDGKMMPNKAIDRQTLMVMLHRYAQAAGMNTAVHERTGIMSYEGADEVSSWAVTAMRWAVGSGVMRGYGDTDLAPTDVLTREQAAAFLHRFAAYLGADVSEGEDTNILSFADAGEIHSWAMPAMQWACGAGVISGYTDADGEQTGELGPADGCTRAQAATMMMRFDAIA